MNEGPELHPEGMTKCEVCGGRRSACAVLGHRRERDRGVLWHPDDLARVPPPDRDVSRLDAHDPGNAAMRTLMRMGYTHSGGIEWRPPFGRKRSLSRALGRLLAAFPKGNADQHGADCECVYCAAAKVLADHRTEQAAPSVASGVESGAVYWHNPENGQVWSDVDVRFHCKNTMGWARVVIPAAPGAAIAAREQAIVAPELVAGSATADAYRKAGLPRDVRDTYIGLLESALASRQEAPAASAKDADSDEAMEQILDLVRQDGEAWHAHTKDNPAPGSFEEWKSVRKLLVSILRDHFELTARYKTNWAAVEGALTEALPNWADGDGPIADDARNAIKQLAQEPEWIVNSIGELGVRVGGRFFFLYKGDSIEYGEPGAAVATHDDDGTPMRYRPVGKVEFGEVQWPAKWLAAGRRERRYSDVLFFIPGLSDGKPEQLVWRDLPAKPAAQGDS